MSRPRMPLGRTLGELLDEIGEDQGDAWCPPPSSRLFARTEREADRFASHADEVHVDPDLAPDGDP